MNSPDQNFKFYNHSIIQPKIIPILTYNSMNSKIFPNESIEKIHVNSKLLTANVYVNPNFKPRSSPAMHINPKIHAKPLIHVNPKMMHDIASSNQNLQNNNVISTTETNINSNSMQIDIKRSIYVNPTLLKKLSSSGDKSLNSKTSIASGRSTSSRLTPAKNIDNRKVITKKISVDSSVVLLSRRKLVRVASTASNASGSSSMTKYISQGSVNSIEKKSSAISQKAIKISLSMNASQSTSSKCNLPKSNIKSKVTKYKIDRTALRVQKVKRSSPPKTRKVTNNTVGLVTIGGIVYKSSKNRLIRRSCSLKRKRSVNGNNDKCVINNSKKLRNGKESLNRASEMNISSKTRPPSNISLKAYKNNISNKVKQRSIQILRNKMRKNNQPCLIFQRFGYCINHKNGVCPKRHDKKQVSICKRFLQGKCLLDKCPLSHDVGPEKMPTCKYFLDGCCTRDACPYLHVKVSSNTSICIDFLQGYCAKGNECQRRHEYLCPEFDKSGKCSKGKYCSYPHKSHSSSVEESPKYVNKKNLCKNDVQKYQATTSVAKDDSEISNPESRLRYYERTDNLSDDFERKKENILRKVKIMKNTLDNDSIVNTTNQTQIHKTDKSLVKEGEDNTVRNVNSNLTKRTPIGTLPSYIPIN